MVDLPFPSSGRGEASTGWSGRVGSVRNQRDVSLMVELPFPSSRRGEASTGWSGRVLGGIRLMFALPGSSYSSTR